MGLKRRSDKQNAFPINQLLSGLDFHRCVLALSRNPGTQDKPQRTGNAYGRISTADDTNHQRPVSYTHLDVYKRQFLYKARELCHTPSFIYTITDTSFNSLHLAVNTRG